MITANSNHFSVILEASTSAFGACTHGKADANVWSWQEVVALANLFDNAKSGYEGHNGNEASLSVNGINAKELTHLPEEIREWEYSTCTGLTFGKMEREIRLYYIVMVWDDVEFLKESSLFWSCLARGMKFETNGVVHEMQWSKESAKAVSAVWHELHDDIRDVIVQTILSEYATLEAKQSQERLLEEADWNGYDDDYTDNELLGASTILRLHDTPFEK